MHPRAHKGTRHHGNPEPIGHHRNDCQPLPHRVGNLRMDAKMAITFAGATLAREHHEAFMLQLFQRHGLAVDLRVDFRQTRQELVFGQGQVCPWGWQRGGVYKAGVDLAEQPAGAPTSLYTNFPVSPPSTTNSVPVT